MNDKIYVDFGLLMLRLIMNIVYTIEDGIQSFADEFDFAGKKNTERTYLRALTLFKEFVESDSSNKTPEYRSLALTSPLSSLPKYIASGFSSWLRAQEFPVEYRGRRPNVEISESPHLPVPTRKYSLATINLYESAFSRVLDFWRDRERISFSVISQKTSERASTTRKSRKNKCDVRLKALAVPKDLGIVLRATTQQWVSDLPEGCTRLERLKRLRSRALVYVLTDSGLRASDLINLTVNWRNTLISPEGASSIDTIKSGSVARCCFSELTLQYVDEYLSFRSDESPWLFIQHGKTGVVKPTNMARYSRVNTNTHDLRRGYGAPITTLTVWRIVRAVADIAGYDRKKNSDYVVNSRPMCTRDSRIDMYHEKECGVG